MTAPVLALRAAIVARCTADPVLASLLGGTASVRDEPPRGAAPVYAIFGDGESRDASTSTGKAHEHDLAIRVWAQAGSAASGLAAAGRIADLLDDANLTLAGHRLVSLAATALAIDRDAETNLACVTLRLRAYTEVAG